MNEITIYHVLILLGFIVTINALTFLLLYFSIGPRGRKMPPLEVMEVTAKVFWLLYIKGRRNIFWLHKLEGRGLWISDWERGLGYGYLTHPPKLGDLLYVKAPKGKYHKLVFVRLHQPDENNPKFFIFKTYYLGTADEQKPEKPGKHEGFQHSV